MRPKYLTSRPYFMDCQEKFLARAINRGWGSRAGIVRRLQQRQRIPSPGNLTRRLLLQLWAREKCWLRLLIPWQGDIQDGYRHRFGIDISWFLHQTISPSGLASRQISPAPLSRVCPLMYGCVACRLVKALVTSLATDLYASAQSSFSDAARGGQWGEISHRFLSLGLILDDTY